MLSNIRINGGIKMTRKVFLICICFAILITFVSGFIGYSIGNKASFESQLEGDTVMEDKSDIEEENSEDDYTPILDETDSGSEIVTIEDAIMLEETAIKIGRAILEEHFPYQSFENETLEANINKGIWRINTTPEESGVKEDGNYWLVLGGMYYVEIRQANGEILKIGVDD